MPSRNIVRKDSDHTYYHVYARGISKGEVFREPQDKDYFLYLLSRHLSIEQVSSRLGYAYRNFRGQVELLTFCLMDNHFHLLFYQVERGTLSELMKSILVAYTAYFNRKYKRTGPLFESRFKASAIQNDAYVQHISRYIHLNPRGWKRFAYSGLLYIRNSSEPEWLQTERILVQHRDRDSYIEFVSDYEDHKAMLDQIKNDLANL